MDAEQLTVMAALLEDEEEVSQPDQETLEPALKIIKGVLENQNKLDEILTAQVHGWKLNRLGMLELLIMRVGLYCLNIGILTEKELISSITNLLSAYGLERARNLVLGVLAAYARTKKGRS